MTVKYFINYNSLKNNRSLSFSILRNFIKFKFSPISKWLHMFKPFHKLCLFRFLFFVFRFADFTFLKQSPFFSHFTILIQFTFSAFSQVLHASLCMRTISFIHCKLCKAYLIGMIPIFNLYLKVNTIPTFVC